MHTEAKKLIFHVFRHFTPVDPENLETTPMNDQSPQISREQYNQVIEIYLFHILEPTAGLDSVLKILNGGPAEDPNLPLPSIDKSLVSSTFLFHLSIIF
jgi:hypothetical protein